MRWQNLVSARALGLAAGLLGVFVPALAHADPCAPGLSVLSGTLTGGSAKTAGGSFIELCNPIGDLGDDSLASSDLRAFAEKKSVTLATTLTIGGAVLPAGTTVSSYYVAFHPVGTKRAVGTVTFPAPIVAIASTRASLLASDFLGDVSAVYTDVDGRGLESGDSTTGLSGLTLSVDFTASTPGDFVRVLTSADPAVTPDNVCTEGAGQLSGDLTESPARSAGGKFVELCDPIGPVGNDNFQTNDLYAFAEAHDVVLDAPLTLDEGPATHLPAGSSVSSYYVVFDPDQVRAVKGYIDFPEPILAVATSRSALGASDFLGDTTAIYLNPSARGLEPGDDSVDVLDHRLTVSLNASSPGDSIRVLTGTLGDDHTSSAGAGGAEPGSAGAGGADTGGNDTGTNDEGGQGAETTPSAGGVDAGGTAPFEPDAGGAPDQPSAQAGAANHSAGGSKSGGAQNDSGCSCRVANDGDQHSTGLVLALTLAVAAVLRRRTTRTHDR